MNEYKVVVADGLRARFFTLEGVRDPEIESGPRLVEQEALLNPAKAFSESERTGNSTSGRTRSPSGGFYAFDDHRSKHGQQALRRFAQQVVNKAIHQSHPQGPYLCVVFAAEKKLLGAMRAEWSAIKTNGLEIRECDRDIVGETPVKIQELLARRELLPALQKPTRSGRR